MLLLVVSRKQARKALKLKRLLQREPYWNSSLGAASSLLGLKKIIIFVLREFVANWTSVRCQETLMPPIRIQRSHKYGNTHFILFHFTTLVIHPPCQLCRNWTSFITLPSPLHYCPISIVHPPSLVHFLFWFLGSVLLFLSA